MGRFFGRRPDRTQAIGRAARRHLTTDEQVIAGVDVQRPGTTSAALQGGTSGAVGSAVGNLPPTFTGGEMEASTWVVEATAAGIDERQARRIVWASLLLTSSRLMVLRRSRLSGKVKEPIFEWPIDEVERIDVPRNGDSITIQLADRSIRFELPLDHKFLPAVYRELPKRLASVKASR